MRMKFLMITEYDAKDFEAFLRKDSQISADREQNPEKYPKRILAGLGLAGEWPKLSPDTLKGIDILEADAEQIENHKAFWWAAQAEDVPSVRKTYIPLLDGASTLPKAFALMRK